ncbi:hypothetical protein GCM10023152_34960 [Agromyces bauzanensis]|uniref:Uncharacterized protein n=1 Tax=Agromyces bauzanensis TaxID=1308924 RepID=A0A917PVG3_9MICO|nr:hypothetical protein GCM10011372_36080 [Agromyces bauzanensis]
MAAGRSPPDPRAMLQSGIAASYGFNSVSLQVDGRCRWDVLAGYDSFGWAGLRTTTSSKLSGKRVTTSLVDGTYSLEHSNAGTAYIATTKQNLSYIPNGTL